MEFINEMKVLKSSKRSVRKILRKMNDKYGTMNGEVLQSLRNKKRTRMLLYWLV